MGSNAGCHFCFSWDVTRVFARFRVEGGYGMFLLLAIVLILLWVGGFFLMHISSLLIHLLIIFAVISLVMHLITGRRD